MAELKFTVGDVHAASTVLLASARNLIDCGQTLWPLETLTPERLLRHYPQDSWRVAWLRGDKDSD